MIDAALEAALAENPEDKAGYLKQAGKYGKVDRWSSAKLHTEREVLYTVLTEQCGRLKEQRGQLKELW